MELDEDHKERVRCTLVPEVDQNYRGDNLAVSHSNTRQTNNTTQTSGSTETRCNLRAKAIPKKYTDFLIHQISDARAALRPLGTQRDDTRTHSSQQQTSSENIHESNQAAHGLNISPRKSSENIHLHTDTSQSNSFVSKLRGMFEKDQQTPHTYSVRTTTHAGSKRTHKKVSFLLTSKVTMK